MERLNEEDKEVLLMLQDTSNYEPWKQQDSEKFIKVLEQVGKLDYEILALELPHKTKNQLRMKIQNMRE